MYQCDACGFFAVSLCFLAVAVAVCFCRPGIKSVRLYELTSVGEDTTHGFVQIGEVAVDSKGSIFVTDRFRYAVKKFNSQGAFVAEFGRRGRGHGEFRAVPYKIDCILDTLAVAEAGTDRIQFFSDDFKPSGEIRAAGPVASIAVDKRGNIYASIIPYSGKRDDILMSYDKRGYVTSRIPLDEAKGEPAFDMTLLCVDSKNRLIVAYQYINQIFICNEGHEIVGLFSVIGVPPRAGRNTELLQKLGSLPEGALFNDVGVDDQGHILILGGDYSLHPNRDVYVLDYSGGLLATFTLPDQTGLLYVDQHGYLYTRERHRRILKKYKVEYVGD